MSRLSRWTAALLAVCILINLIPVSSFAQTGEIQPTDYPLAQSDETILIEEETQATEEVTVPTEEETLATEEVTVPTEEETQATEEVTVPTEEETQATEEVTVPTEEETQATEEETVPTEEETQATEGETLPTEEEKLAAVLEADINAKATFTDFSARYFAAVLEKQGYAPGEILSEDKDSGKVTLTVYSVRPDILALLSNTPQGPVTPTPTQSEEGEGSEPPAEGEGSEQTEGEPTPTQPEVFDYSNWIIAFPDVTSTLYLPKEFTGLGDKDYPFAGTLTGTQCTLSTENTLFKELDASAALGSIKIAWTGTADKAILTNKLWVGTDNRPIAMPLTSAAAFSPYIGQLLPKDGVTAPGEITLPDLNYNSGTAGAEYTEAAGLLCGTMQANTKLKFDSTLTLPSTPVSISSAVDVGALVGKMEANTTLTFSAQTAMVTALSGVNTGGLVGAMAENANLTISSPLTLTNTLNGSGNAGGLAGSLAGGASIRLNANVTIAKAGTEEKPIYNTITAAKSAGGLVGEMTTTTGSVLVSGGCTISLTDTESKVTGGTNAGGLYGSCTASGDLNPFTGVTIGKAAVTNATVGTTTIKDLTMETVTVGGNGSCGGLFGTLNLTENGNKCTVASKSLYVKLHSASETTYVGGIVGTLNGGRDNALVVTNSAGDKGNPSTTPHIIVNTKPDGKNTIKPKYLGGLVAYQNATLEVKNTFAGFPYASQTYHTDKTNYYTGGLSAYVCDDMLLMADNMRIIFSGYTNDDHNGGVAGYTGKGSIVYLKSKLLLRDCPLQSVQGCGQIVATQDCSLIYGPGVTISRWGQGMEVDDIGNYGEMYRVPGLLEVGSDYSTVLKRTLTAQEGIYTLTDALDYACLALAWQSRGEFGTVSDITAESWENLRSCNIKLGNNIDLTGMGIGGLSRDVYSGDDVFKGTFDGNGKTLKLDIGATNAEAGASNSDGRIYFHNSTGLFAGLSSNATVQNLTLAGSIRLSNNRLPVNADDQRANMKTGALAGLLLCEAGKSSITNVSTTVSITANSNTQTPNAPFYIGGLFGLAYGDADTTLTLNGNLGASITHQLSDTLVGQCFHIGGAIGAVDAGCTNLEIICNGATISGKIERIGTAAENFYAGGLIGTIFPNGSSSRTITLTNLKVGQASAEGITAKPFELKGSAEKRMGGVLGGIWADTDVTVSGLVVENATLTASGTAKLGGLVYRASGKWEVSSADLGGLTIKAGSAEGLGLMVCQGGTYREPLDYNKGNGSDTGAYKEIGGLYLVMTEHWDKGYLVPHNGKITVKGDCVFDEFVAYTAYAHYTEGNKDTPPYSITSNGSGIISLKTGNGTVNMTGSASNRNTYENRTDVAKKTNLYSRYYYNLPEVLNDCTDNTVDTAQELLIWSVCRYAASNLTNYFSKGETVKGSTLAKTITIGGTDTGTVSFDMNGLSYYPIRITDSRITVQYADVTFCNKKIEDQVSDEKSTRGSAEEHTQHYTMHCGLFMDFAAEALEYPETKNYTMMVNGVTFAGTIGKVNGQSGALLCGTVRGKFSGNAATCTVQLAADDRSNYAVTLNGITVDSTDGYKPVLIGKIWEYATLQANYVTVSAEQKSVAGSSLIGDVGHSAATGLAVTFAGTIKLPSEEKTSIFTSATLLNSLRYQGSTPATYQFIKEKDWAEDGSHVSHVQNVTYGYEISGSVEFLDEQQEYFDGGFVSSSTSEAKGPGNFSTYLPYVARSPAKNDDEGTYSVENGYHELEVNVKPTNLLRGCGTYGDPYVLDSEKLLKSVAKYLEHPEKTINGWQIRYPASEDYHTDNSSDITLTFDSANRKWDNNKSIDDIRKHLSNAYYVIEKEMNLVSFSGLGTEDYPFSGVIQGKDEQTKNITMSGTSQALIRYSNGSVVRNLKFTLAQNTPLRSSAPEMINGVRTANRAPKNFFGGVIGCVLGGDNIIDNVSVTVSTPENKPPYHFPEGYASFAHLVPIGGYVGVIAGGGVIFRGSIPSSTGITGNSNQLYRNPIVGRVLGGYAFYEGTPTNAPDNTDKNYKINAITSGTHLSLSGDTLTIKDSEGLLILSAIVSSGAGSYGNSLAYKTDYGVARVAKYDKVGNGAATAPEDYALANNQTTPYLLYREGISAKPCQSGEQSGITLKLDADLNMGIYGNGYRGLSARYVSNAGFTTASTLSPYTVVMRLKSFDGNNKTVSGISMNVREYDDDDFHAASMGGIFNIAWTNNGTGGSSSNSSNASSKYDSVLAKNLTLKDCTVKLEYIDANGSQKPQAQYKYFTQTDGISTVAVGGFIGTVNDRNSTGMSSTASNYLFENIRVEATEGKRSTIYGPISAGGIIGASGMGSKGCPAMLLTNGGEASSVKFGPSFLNCSYSNTDVTGYLAAGGMVGCAATGYDNLVSFGKEQDGVASGCFATCTITNQGLVFAENSTVQTKSSGGICGGVFGGIGMRGRINEPEIYNPGRTDAKPMVNYLTGLSVLGKVEDIQTLRFKNVKFYADLAFDQHIKYDGGTINGVENGKAIAVGGCIGRISHANPVRIYQVQMGQPNTDAPLRCEIKVMKTTETAPSTPDVAEQYAGGLIGYGYTTREMKIQDCTVYCTDISGPTAGGLIAVSGFSTLNVINCAVENCTVDASTRAGGLAGYLNYTNCTANLLNILVKNTSVTKDLAVDANVTGRLFGQIHSSYQLIPYAAGISVFAKDSTIQLPDKDSASSYATGYIAYANYLAEQTAKPSGSKDPYVTVNPSRSLLGTDKTLFGDAVKVSGSYGSIGERIWKENTSAESRVPGSNYTPYKAVDFTKITKPNISNFYAALGEGPKDLPVLLVKGGDAKAITDYLDIITNGGYTAASTDTVNKVTFETTVYYLSQEEYAFSTVNWDTAHTGDPSVTTTDGGKKLVVSGTSYDNTRHRFTLVEATFHTDLGSYTVSIPVVVLRKLEFVYMTTFSNGTEFHKQTYEDIETHLLESTGVPFSAYLTFRYNQAYNENTTENTTSKLEYAEYDWKSYIEGGGNLIGMDKTLNFSVTLPKGTQLTLVDCQHGNQAYYYIVKEVKEGGEKDILLSSFRKNPADDTSTAFHFSMADVLGVTRSEKSVETGAFTKLTGSEGATLLVNGEYFRPANDEDAPGNRYNLIFPTSPSSAVPEENYYEENYYLVITVPTQYTLDQKVDTTFARNGHLEVSLTNYLIPTNGTQVHRYGDSGKHMHDSDETTYNISSGYQQSLEANNDQLELTVDLNDVNNAMQMELTDTITFSNAQAYSSTDLLFLKFTASLKQTTVEGGKKPETDSGFPAGATGTVKFFIQDSSGNYYVPDGNNGWKIPENTEKNYLDYGWLSEGGNLSLPLSADGTTPIDLSGVRGKIKDNKTEGTSKIFVKAIMENVVVPPGGDDDPIPSSEDGTDAWAQIHYLAQLSTQARSLNYSTVRAVTDDTARYYRKAANKVILSMDAATISQLGVNPLAPVNVDPVNGCSRIDLNAALDFTEYKDREALLQNTEKIVFTLSLERRSDGQGASYQPVTGGNAYISFQWPDRTENWSFTVSKENGRFNQGFNEELYMFQLTAYVAMDQTQYANYKIQMDVDFYDINNEQIRSAQKNILDANVVYTYACIKPSFYDPTGSSEGTGSAG